MTPGTRRALRECRWKKQDGTEVVVEKGEEFYCIGKSDEHHCVVVLGTKHLFVSNVDAVERISEAVEEPAP